MDIEIITMHGRLNATRRRWATGLAMVEDQLAATDRSYVSWSGGKDSTAVALLVHRVAPSVPMIRRSRGVDYPEVVTYCDQLAARHGWDYRVAVGGTADDYAALIGIDEHDVIVDHHAEAARVLGYPPDGWLYGLRIDESLDRRKLLTRTRGTWTSVEGLRACAPCWNWSRLDVLAWLQHCDTEPCPVYTRLEQLGCPEQSQRVGYMVGGGGVRTGRYTWLKLGWPEQWEQLCTLVPWLRAAS